MKKQRFDYSGFSLRRLNEPRFAHIKLPADQREYRPFRRQFQPLLP